MISKRLRLGLIINPFAGLGGPRAHKGSDNKKLAEQALLEHWPLSALARVRTFLTSLNARTLKQIQWFAPPGLMGGTALSDAGLSFNAVAAPIILPGQPSTAEDTKAAARALLDAGVDFILFVGGDGTARDVLSVLPDSQAALGIPAGVKMQSGVYAISPELAAELVEKLAAGDLVRLNLAEVRDIDEAALQHGIVKSRHFGEMLTLAEPQFVQHTKQGGIEQESLVSLDIADYLAETLAPDTLLVVGPGSTTHSVMQEWGLATTLLGVDLIKNKQIVALDVNQSQIDQAVQQADGPVLVLITIIGGQGYLFGRGNQQISASLLRSLGKQHVRVVATKSKLKDLQGRPLLMDSGDAQLDRSWQGYINVLTGYQDEVVYPVGIQGAGRDL